MPTPRLPGWMPRWIQKVATIARDRVPQPQLPRQGGLLDYKRGF